MAQELCILSNGPIKIKDNVVMLYSVDHNSYPSFQNCLNRNDNLGRHFHKRWLFLVADSRCGQYCYYAGPTPCLMLSLIFVLSTINFTAGSTTGLFSLPPCYHCSSFVTVPPLLLLPLFLLHLLLLLPLFLLHLLHPLLLCLLRSSWIRRAELQPGRDHRVQVGQMEMVG